MNLETFRGKEVLISNNTGLILTIQWIKKIARASAESPEIQRIAESLKGSTEKETVKKVFEFAFNSVVYLPDPGDAQLLRTAERSINEKRGNCVDYTILISALLIANGIPHFYKVVSFTSGKNWAHIYPVTRSGFVLDAVQGQRQDGTDTVLNRGKPMFNKETEFINKKIFDMPVKLKVLGRSHMGQDNGAVVSTTTQVVESAEKILGLFDKCKIGCDLKHLFNSSKRKACKCNCACQFGSVYQPGKGKTCNDFGVNLSDPVACPRGTPTAQITTAQPQLQPTQAGINPILLVGLVGAGAFMLLGQRKRRR